MAFTSYSALQTAIANILHRTDLTTAIKDFITLAEESINQDLYVMEMVSREQDSSANSEYQALPDRFKEMIRFVITSTSPVTELEFIPPQQFYKFTNTEAGKPKKFTIIDNQIQFDRTPDTTYTIQMTFWKKVAALSDSNTSNDILTNYPNVYYYGALMHSAPYIKEDPRIAVWSAAYTAAVSRANAHSRRMMTPRYGNQRRSNVSIY